MGVVKRGDRWSAIVELGPDPVTGKRRQKRLSGFGSKREAQRALEDARFEYVIREKQQIEAAEQYRKALERVEQLSLTLACSERARTRLRLELDAKLSYDWKLIRSSWTVIIRRDGKPVETLDLRALFVSSGVTLDDIRRLVRPIIQGMSEGNGNALPTATRTRIIKRDGETCGYCKGTGDSLKGPDGVTWHIDHVVPRAKGGSDADSNLCLACATCNLAKSSQDVEQFMRLLRSTRAVVA